MTRQTIETQWTAEDTKLVLNLIRLSKAGHIGIVLAEAGKYYIGERIDPWGTKIHYTVSELQALVLSFQSKGPGVANDVDPSRCQELSIPVRLCS